MIGSKKLVAVFLLCALGGTVVEGAAILLGNWHYANGTLLNIPFWLPVAWGNAGIFIVSIYKLLDQFEWLRKN